MRLYGITLLFLSQNFKIHMIQESYKVFHMTCAIFLSKTNLLSHRSFLQREDFDTKFSILQFSDKFLNRQNRYTVTSSIIIVENEFDPTLPRIANVEYCTGKILCLFITR